MWVYGGVRTVFVHCHAEPQLTSIMHWVSMLRFEKNAPNRKMGIGLSFDHSHIPRCRATALHLGGVGEEAISI